MLKMLALVFLFVAAVFGQLSAGPIPEQQFSELPLLPRLPGKIVNGTETTIEENPHQISLHIPGRGHLCGESIISRYWILTAAHCMAPHLAPYYVVIAGMTNLSEGGSHHNIEKYIVHQEFYINRYGSLTNDVALIKVALPSEFDSKHGAIPLFAANEEARPGFASVVTGWGYTGYQYPDTLNLVVVPIISKARCSELFDYLGGLPAGDICAGCEQGEEDACTGDSGGPLTINGRLAGVVSWGHGCAEPGRPGVYAEVAAHRDWIRLNTGV